MIDTFVLEEILQSCEDHVALAQISDEFAAPFLTSDDVDKALRASTTTRSASELRELQETSFSLSESSARLRLH